MAKDNSVSSIMRTIRVIKHIVESDTSVTFNELGKLGIPKTTLFRILSSLQKENWIEKKGSSYTPGNGMLRLGMVALSKLELRKIAVPWINKLSQQTGETANLAVLSGKRGLIIEVCDGPKHIRISSRPGTFTSLHCSSAGKVFLAFAVEEKLEDFLKDILLERRTKNTITDFVELGEEIARIRRKGYAVDDMEYYDDVRCIAAPVKNAYGKTVAAVGITAPAANLKKQQITSVAEIVVDIAAAISRELGESKE